MLVDKTYLESCKKDLENQMRGLQADANRIQGALRLLDAQLAYLELPEKKDESKVGDGSEVQVVS